MDIRQLMLPAGVGVSHVKVYTAPGPDGAIGGSPHMHTVCSEMYYCLSGRGYVETLSGEGYQKIELEPAMLVSFRPGLIHRVLNPHENLELLIIMQNGGLSERGDFVLTFPEAIVKDPTAYAQAAMAKTDEQAFRRRNLAVEGFQPLRQAMELDRSQGLEMLRRFYSRARDIIAPKVEGFEWVLKSGAQAEINAGLDALDFLRMGRVQYLERASCLAISPMSDPANIGLDGKSHPFARDEKFMAEGKRAG